ncbi:MAG: DeoR/GlpR family DNA-binding transcription regulator [Candidatus Neoclostridium sp.]
MIGTQRQNELLEYMKKYETVSVKQIVKKFYISEATARRDLNALEKSGLIRRVFGGATLVIGSDKQIPLFVRERENEQEKTELCRRAAEYIHDGDILFIDGSSTVQFLLPYLEKFKDIVVITNGLKIAQMLSEIHIKVFVAGGLLIENSSVLVGEDTVNFISNFNADICFLSCKGLSDDGKLTDTSYEETKIRKCYLKNSKTKIVLMSSNKIGKTYLHTLCCKEEIDRLITPET